MDPARSDRLSQSCGPRGASNWGIVRALADDEQAVAVAAGEVEELELSYDGGRIGHELLGRPGVGGTDEKPPIQANVSRLGTSCWDVRATPGGWKPCRRSESLQAQAKSHLAARATAARG